MSHPPSQKNQTTPRPPSPLPLPSVVSESAYELARDEVQSMFRKVSKDPVNQALYKAVLEYRLEKAL